MLNKSAKYYNARLNLPLLFPMWQKSKERLLRNIVNLAFLAGYVVLGLTIAQQNDIIGTQRVLIRSLFYDSTQLAQIKGQQAIENASK